MELAVRVRFQVPTRVGYMWIRIHNGKRVILHDVRCSWLCSRGKISYNLQDRERAGQTRQDGSSLRRPGEAKDPPTTASANIMIPILQKLPLWASHDTYAITE